MINRAKSMLSWRAVAVALGILILSSLALHAQINVRPPVGTQSGQFNKPNFQVLPTPGGGIAILQAGQAMPVTPPIPNIRPGGGINANGFNSLALSGGNGGFGGQGGQGGFGGQGG